MAGGDQLQERGLITLENSVGALGNKHHYFEATTLVGDLTALVSTLADCVKEARGGRGKEAAAADVAAKKALDAIRHVCVESRQWAWLLRGDWKTDSDASQLHQSYDEGAKEREVFDERRAMANLRYEVDQEEMPGFCHPARVLQQLSAMLGPDDVVTVDTGDITLWTSLCLSLKEEQRVLSSQGMGTMVRVTPPPPTHSLPHSLTPPLTHPPTHPRFASHTGLRACGGDRREQRAGTRVQGDRYRRRRRRANDYQRAVHGQAAGL